MTLFTTFVSSCSKQNLSFELVTPVVVVVVVATMVQHSNIVTDIRQRGILFLRPCGFPLVIPVSHINMMVGGLATLNWP